MAESPERFLGGAMNPSHSFLAKLKAMESPEHFADAEG
jgi:hypothetical protein